MFRIMPAIAGTLLVALCASAQTKYKDTEWASYAADLAGTRYRPLDQINASNFSKLEVAWRFKTDSIGNRPEYKLEGTPLMVNGVVYTSWSSHCDAGAYFSAEDERAALLEAPRTPESPATALYPGVGYAVISIRDRRAQEAALYMFREGAAQPVGGSGRAADSGEAGAHGEGAWSRFARSEIALPPTPARPSR